MIGLIGFIIGLVFGTAATFVNVLFNYDGESSVLMVIWAIVIIVMLALLFMFFSALTFGGVIV